MSVPKICVPNFIEDLRHPAAYPWHPPTVEVIETHISWVFLAGDRVLKVKRPVDLGFVDFSDPELRRTACKQEKELNRRLTTDVYLDVVAIRRTNGRHQVAISGGTTVEWATLMRRLPADSMLDQLIRDDAVPEDAVVRIADRLIPFHLDAAAPCHDFSFQALAVVTENLDQLRSLADGLIEMDLLRLVDSAMRQFIEMRETLFAGRADRWIVEGHGDLRCEHICLEPDTATQIFDCVEFSYAIRCADVASDLAFLVMDLRRLDASHLANELLSHYHAAGAEPPEDLVRFYAAHRALVRAKVACIEAQSLSLEQRASYTEEAADHLNLATAFAFRPEPVIIAVTGLSGTGKSTVARAISRALDATYISSDAIRKDLAQIDPFERAGAGWQSGIYSPEWTTRTYERMRQLAAESISSSKPVVLDATYLDTDERELLAKLATRSSAPLVIVEVTCDETVALRRIRHRSRQQHAVSDATEEIHLKQRASVETAPPLIPIHAIACRVDNSADGPVSLFPVLSTLLEEHFLNQI